MADDAPLIRTYELGWQEFRKTSGSALTATTQTMVTPVGSPAHVPAAVEGDAAWASFGANVALVVVAIVALWVARRQAQHASKARFAEAVDRTLGKWESASLRGARDALERLEDEAVSAWQETLALDLGVTRGDFVPVWIHLQLRRMNESPATYESFFLLAQMIEEIGVLCRSGYLSLEDIKNFIGSGLFYCTCLLMPHIEWRRAYRDRSPTNWAHFIWLWEELPTTPVYEKLDYGLGPAARAR